MHRNELGGLWLMASRDATLQGGLHDRQVGVLFPGDSRMEGEETIWETCNTYFRIYF